MRKIYLATSSDRNEPGNVGKFNDQTNVQMRTNVQACRETTNTIILAGLGMIRLVRRLGARSRRQLDSIRLGLNNGKGKVGQGS